MSPDLAAELEHLLKWAKDQTGFQEYARWKANHLAVQEPATWNELPLLLSNAVQTSKHGPPRSLRPSIPVQRCTGRSTNATAAGEGSQLTRAGCITEVRNGT